MTLDVAEFQRCLSDLPLQEDVMEFVNSIAKIVHMEVSLHGGAPNKNIGDAFLLVWKLPEDFTSADIPKPADVFGPQQQQTVKPGRSRSSSAIPIAVRASGGGESPIRGNSGESFESPERLRETRRGAQKAFVFYCRRAASARLGGNECCDDWARIIPESRWPEEIDPQAAGLEGYCRFWQQSATLTRDCHKSRDKWEHQLQIFPWVV